MLDQIRAELVLFYIFVLLFISLLFLYIYIYDCKVNFKILKLLIFFRRLLTRGTSVYNEYFYYVNMLSIVQSSHKVFYSTSPFGQVPKNIYRPDKKFTNPTFFILLIFSFHKLLKAFACLTLARRGLSSIIVSCNMYMTLRD